MNDEISPKDRATLIFIMYNIFFVNDVALSYIFDVLTELKRTPLYKKEIKFRANVLESYMRQYNVLLDVRSKGATEFIAEINERMNDEIANDLKRLEFATLHELQKCFVPYPKLLMYVAIAHTMCNAACSNVDISTTKNEIQRINYYSKNFRDFKIKKIADCFYLLSDLIVDEARNKHDYYCDLSNIDTIGNGYAIILKKLKNPKIIWDIVNKQEHNNNN
jgi:hypothetical protein